VARADDGLDEVRGRAENSGVRRGLEDPAVARAATPDISGPTGALLHPGPRHPRPRLPADAPPAVWQSKKSRIPPRIVFPEDLVRQRVVEDPEIAQVRSPTAPQAFSARRRCVRWRRCDGASPVPARASRGHTFSPVRCIGHVSRLSGYLQLFDGRKHPLGDRPGVDDNSRELPFFEPRSVRLEATVKHGEHSSAASLDVAASQNRAVMRARCDTRVTLTDARFCFLMIWTGPQLWEKVTRKFVSHHSRLTAKGFTDDEA